MFHKGSHGALYARASPLSRAETHLLPVTLFSWVADQARTLRSGSAVTIAAHLNDTKFTQPSGEVSHGIQLIADALLFPPPRKEPNGRS